MANLRIIVLGLQHDHVWSHLSDIDRSLNAKLVGVAEPELPLLAKFKKRYRCPTYADANELMDRIEADAAYIFSDNRTGSYLAATAAARGLHVMIEKPMAADVESADHMLQVADEHQVQLMVNWPFAWSRPLQKALDMVHAGDIGRPWQVRYRAAHAGPRELGCSDYFCEWLFDHRRNGGGALIDYACYGTALARVVLGMPDSVKAVGGTYCKAGLSVEDNAIVLMSYAGASAIAEASWTQQGVRTSYQAEIYGEEGSLIAEPGDEGRLWLATETAPNGRLVDLPEADSSNLCATSHFHWSISKEKPLMPLVSAPIGRDAQAILAAAQRALGASGEVVPSTISSESAAR